MAAAVGKDHLDALLVQAPRLAPPAARRPCEGRKGPSVPPQHGPCGLEEGAPVVGGGGGQHRRAGDEASRRGGVVDGRVEDVVVKGVALQVGKGEEDKGRPHRQEVAHDAGSGDL